MSAQTITPSPLSAPTSTPKPAAAARTKLLLEGPILPTLLRLAAPNVLNLLAFVGVIVFDGFFLGLGDALREHDISVLVVRPGFVKTKMTADREAMPLAVTPDEVAEAVVAAVRDRRDLIWVPPSLRAVMSGLRHVPRPVFRRLPV